MNAEKTKEIPPDSIDVNMVKGIIDTSSKNLSIFEKNLENLKTKDEKREAAERKKEEIKGFIKNVEDYCTSLLRSDKPEHKSKTEEIRHNLDALMKKMKEIESKYSKKKDSVKPFLTKNGDLPTIDNIPDVINAEKEGSANEIIAKAREGIDFSDNFAVFDYTESLEGNLAGNKEHDKPFYRELARINTIEAIKGYGSFEEITKGTINYGTGVSLNYEKKGDKVEVKYAGEAFTFQKSELLAY